MFLHWFTASFSNIGQLAMAVVTGFLANSIGRKATIIVICIPLFVGWAVTGVSNGNVVALCCGRILQGVGILSSVSQVYLVEIADPVRRYGKLLCSQGLCILNRSSRGSFGAIGALSVSAGITLVYVLGACLNWRWVCAACGAIPVTAVFAMLALPETPSWLAARGQVHEAKKASATRAILKLPLWRRI